MSTPPAATLQPTPTVKMPIVPLLLSIVLSVMLAGAVCAGTIFWALRSGKLNAGTVAASTTSAAAKAPVAAAEPTRSLALEPLLANLADADGHGYLRLGLTMEIPEGKPAKGEEKGAKGPPPEEAGLRDTVLEVLGHEQSSDLLAADGKEQLKKKLLAALALRQPSLPVRQLYFTEFLVQR